MEWVVVGVVVVIGLLALVITRRRRIEAETQARDAASRGDDDAADGSD